MSSGNLGWFFYKEYYNGIEYHNLESKNNQTLIKEKVLTFINTKISLPSYEILGNMHFQATTLYPGLLLGSGNMHELPSLEGQVILGFYFDYTTGLPTIPSSTVKGVLRSAFKHPDYIEELLLQNKISLEKEKIKDLEHEIFGQDNGSDSVLQGKDIFFDAVIIDRPHDQKILGDDFLAPHKNSKKSKDDNGELIPDELCNPTPLRFIKLLPDVTFSFDFELTSGLVKKEEKLTLFQSILKDIGLGAKTNVGYGRFDKFTEYETEEEKQYKIEQKERGKQQRLEKLSPVERVFDNYNNDPVKIVQAMQNAEIEEYENIKIALAQKVKEELQKSPKMWEKAKQKALKRKEFIASILKE